MKNKLVKSLSSLLLLGSLVSCAASKVCSLEDYISTLTYRDGFSICVMEDIHLSCQSNVKRELQYLEEVVYSRHYADPTHFPTKESARPDVIVLNGDSFQIANKTVVNQFFDFINSLEIPFLFNYGNHDMQGQYSNQYINNLLLKKSNCISKNPNDDLYGEQNTVVNIKDGDNVKWQLYTLDCNTYTGFTYDVIHDDQIEWYESQVNKATFDNDGDIVPSLMFFHIPTEEFQFAWEERGGPDVTHGEGWYMGEGVASGYRENGLFEKCQELGSTKGIFCAHDHVNNTDWDYNGIRLVFGNKTTDGIYHDKSLIGAMFITLDRDRGDTYSIDDKNFNIQRINHTYDGQYNILTDDFYTNFEGGERA